MLIAVIGGKLQGVEAVYLAKKAGWQTLVIDKNPDAPATGLCDRFLEYRFSVAHPIPRNCPKVDLILPAVEDMAVLMAVEAWAKRKNIALAFDLAAYHLSSSKLASNALFKKMNLPAPLPWPECRFPVVVKPDRASGSQGVEVFEESREVVSRFSTDPALDHIVVQEYLEGPAHSIEVLGRPGNYHALSVTDLGMDKTHDCKRVTAPTKLLLPQVRQFEKMALALADQIHLRGIMDVEAICHNNELKLIEIDARFPSQTPMAVYGSTGINMVQMLGNLFLDKEMIFPEQKDAHFVSVEHIRVSGSNLDVCGEHIMSQEGPLTLQPRFLGANEAITSFAPGKNKWVATMIFMGPSQKDVMAKRQKCYDRIHELSILTHEEKTL